MWHDVLPVARCNMGVLDNRFGVDEVIMAEMLKPMIGNKIRFVDRYNGIQYRGKVLREHRMSRCGYPIWIVEVSEVVLNEIARDKGLNNTGSKGAKLSVTQSEVLEIYD